MKYFLTLLFGCVSFFTSAQVIIPSDVARYFLEQDDRVKILKRKDSLNQEIITNLGSELLIKQEIINIYKADSAIYKSILSNKDQQVKLLMESLEQLQKKQNVKNYQVFLFAGTAVGSITGSLLPGIGTTTGAVIGAVAGTIIYGVKKIKTIFK